ncbi:hypothetical protein SASPL_127991 [Salvia splendens]|uniref:Uncharacterized protein n=1 Tax=Salvia splendens TaxID=180675 RepID=A0A8X8ZM30_SALSN|nr:hypothetical protein SASPL_127991 [Salvia splendens]
MLFGDDSKLRNFVNRALLCWNGSRVLKFRFNLRHELASSMFNDVDMWVNFAQRNGVEKLYLHVLWNPTPVRRGLDGKEVYRVPLCLYSCSSLKELSLHSCNLEIYGNVQWNKLESLKISGASIYKFIWDSEDSSVASELRICTPNLETLEINGLPYKYLLTDVSSLTRAVLGSMHLDHMSKELGALKMKCANSAFQNVKSLELTCCLYDCKQVVGILEIFPQLERLVIDEIEEAWLLDDTESLKFEENIPESFLLRLRTTEVSYWYEGYGIFPLTEIMLKYASKLEKFVFYLNETESPAASDSLFLVSQKLLGMWRSSTNCTFNLTKLY